MYNNEYLREIRESQGLTKLDMARLLGMDKANYSKLEAGAYKHFPVEKAKILRNRFKVDALKLLGF